ncbi:MAG: BpuSI family type II restriction endonuclease, partial [Bdellovibrionota bacterium]
MPIENLPIPKYSDDELSVFHPYFRACFDEALRELVLEDDFALQGPFTTRSGQADFALVRIVDSRVLLPIEIKRSPADLRLQGRRQARDYWNNIGPRREGPYFLATNLEIVELFKSDSQRAITESQLLETRLALVGKFATTRPSDFFLRLKASLCEILEIVVNGVVVPYVASVQGFAESLNAVKGEPVRWQQTQALFAFEYLRSALNEFDAYRPEVRTWSKAENYLNNLTRLHDLVSRIDFEPAFQDLEHPLSPALTVSSEALREAYLAGGNEGSGDDFSGVVNEILGNVPGLVETDADLARLVAGFARLNLNSDRNEDFKVLDAGAGAGALTIALKEFAFKSLKLSQIVAVEKEPRLKGILAIRLGLHFIDSLILNVRPNFHARKLEEIDPIDLQAVKLVITNPPFFSAVAMGSDMSEIIEAIRG